MIFKLSIFVLYFSIIIFLLIIVIIIIIIIMRVELVEEIHIGTMEEVFMIVITCWYLGLRIK